MYDTYLTRQINWLNTCQLILIYAILCLMAKFSIIPIDLVQVVPNAVEVVVSNYWNVNAL